MKKIYAIAYRMCDAEDEGIGEPYIVKVMASSFDEATNIIKNYLYSNVRPRRLTDFTLVYSIDTNASQVIGSPMLAYDILLQDEDEKDEDDD